MRAFLLWVASVAFLFSLYARSFPGVIQRMHKVSLPPGGRRGYKDGNDKFPDFLECVLGLLSLPLSFQHIAALHSMELSRGKLVFET